MTAFLWPIFPKLRPIFDFLPQKYTIFNSVLFDISGTSKGGMAVFKKTNHSLLHTEIGTITIPT